MSKLFNPATGSSKLFRKSLHPSLFEKNSKQIKLLRTLKKIVKVKDSTENTKPSVLRCLPVALKPENKPQLYISECGQVVESKAHSTELEAKPQNNFRTNTPTKKAVQQINEPIKPIDFANSLLNGEYIHRIRPDHIDAKHWEELQKSCIDPELAALNFKSLSGDETFDFVLYSQAISRRNDGRLRDSDMRRYAHLSDGGWWCNGVDPLTGEDSLWGCLKPNQPRIDENKNKPIKYEHPPKVPTETFCLKVPAHLWRLIARRYDVPLPEILDPCLFWQWVKLHKLPIIITEGAKKAAALLSLGYIAIALPGINSGYRSPKDEDGNAIGKPALIPQLQHFADGREFYLGFDQDIKRSTIRNVNQALGILSRLLGGFQCPVKILKWLPQLGKGVDDLIFNGGDFDQIYRTALTIREWSTKQLKVLSYKPDLELNQPRLGELDIPRDRQLICLKSPKNTGKSWFLRWITDPIIRSGVKRVLGISHRVQLSTELARKLGLPFVSELSSTPEGSAFGMFLVVDSLHALSQAKFNPDEWKGCWLVLDEIQQLIWHLLNSSTCQKHRVAIIKNFKQLLINVVTHGGKIFIADADLNDISIDFIEGLIGFELSKYIVENTYKFEEQWQVNVFNGSDPANLVKHLEEKLAKGEKHFVCVSGQKAKSRWGSKNLERFYRQKFPDLRILRIDSATVGDKNHPAFGCVGNINQILIEGNYDLVIATPTIETGVSIDEKIEIITDTEIELIDGAHFDGVWGIFQGVQTCDSVRQHLSRYRVPVPRYLWVKEVGINRVGNGLCFVKGLLAGEHQKATANIKILQSASFEEDLDGNFSPTSLITWAKMGAIINAGMANYKAQILADLAAEGHIINDGFELVENEKVDLLTKEEAEETKTEIDITRNEGYQEEKEKISVSDSITDDRYEKLKTQQAKTEKEQFEYRKGQLERTYNIEVTPELVELDDKNWYSKIRLHYYFGEGREFLSEREKNTMSSMLKNGDGDFFKPDMNRNLISSKIFILETLGLAELLGTESISNSSPLAIKVFDLITQNHRQLKLALGIDLSAFKKPMSAIQSVMGLIGYRFPRLGRKGARGQQEWIYGKAAADFVRDADGEIIVTDGKATPLPDIRGDVFKAWLNRDILAREKAAAALEAVATQVLEVSELKSDTQLPITNDQNLESDFLEVNNNVEIAVSVAIPSVSVAIAQLKSVSDWGQITNIPQELINQAWAFLTEDEDARLRQLHQQWTQPQPQSQPEPQSQPQFFRWIHDRFGVKMVLLKLEGAIALVQSLMTNEKLEIPFNELVAA